MAVIRRHFTPEDQAESIYQYVDFDVPATAPALTITLRYDRDPSVIDLGLFGPDEFCGYSGGERSIVVVTPTWATPGYRPMEVGGTWRVLLGLYRVAPDGVDVEIDVDLGPVAPPAPTVVPEAGDLGPRRRLEAGSGRLWVAADFHCHTVHSDGGYRIAELAAEARRAGLEILAVTDHNTTSHHALLPGVAAAAGMVLIPGQEVTTTRGHANCFGDVGWIDFRRPPDHWRDESARRGGLLATNHPWAPGDSAWTWPADHTIPFVEMWHSSWDRADATPLRDWRQFGQVAIGGSDFHRAGDWFTLGRPTTWLAVDEISADAAFDALRAGRIALSATTDGPLVFRRDGELELIDADGCSLVVDDDTGDARLVADGRVVAFTQ